MRIRDSNVHMGSRKKALPSFSADDEDESNVQPYDVVGGVGEVF